MTNWVAELAPLLLSVCAEHNILFVLSASIAIQDITCNISAYIHYPIIKFRPREFSVFIFVLF